jgi:hypothetical protein
MAAAPPRSSCPSSPGPGRPARIIRIISTATRHPAAARLASGSSSHSGTRLSLTPATGARLFLRAFRTVLEGLAAALPQPPHGRSQRQQAINPDNGNIPAIMVIYAGIPACPLKPLSFI